MIMSIEAESKWEFKHQEYNIDAYIQNHGSVNSCQADALLWSEPVQTLCYY